MRVSSPPTIIDVVVFNDTPVTETDVALTVTVQVAVLLPSAVVTVMVAVPTALAVTFPLPSTVATLVLLELHVTFWLVALDGSIIGERVSSPPTARVMLVLFSDTPVTGIGVAFTVTVQVAVLFPSAVVTVIVAVPTAMAVTVPLVTVAAAVLLELHVTALFVALLGATVGISVSVPPTARVMLVLFSDTPVTGIGVALTITVQAAVLPPSAVVTVMVAVPTAIAVTNPFWLTVAIASALELHVTALFAASEGATVGVSVSVPPTTSEILLLSSDTPLTGTGGGGEGGSGSSLQAENANAMPIIAAIANNLIFVFILKSPYLSSYLFIKFNHYFFNLSYVKFTYFLRGKLECWR